MIRTNSDNRQLHWYLGNLNIQNDVKEDLVYQFTNGRETRSSAMTSEECQALITYLRGLKRKLEAPKPTAPAKPDSPENKMRRKVISICHEMGWKLASGKIDMARVNEFCEKRGHKHKVLNFYTKEELPLLITQFEKVLKEFYAKR